MVFCIKAAIVFLFSVNLQNNLSGNYLSNCGKTHLQVNSNTPTASYSRDPRRDLSDQILSISSEELIVILFLLDAVGWFRVNIISKS